MSELPGEVVSSIRDHLQTARGEAAAIGGPSTRQAVESLAATAAELSDGVRGGTA